MQKLIFEDEPRKECLVDITLIELKAGMGVVDAAFRPCVGRVTAHGRGGIGGEISRKYLAPVQHVFGTVGHHGLLHSASVLARIPVATVDGGRSKYSGRAAESSA